MADGKKNTFWFSFFIYKYTGIQEDVLYIVVICVYIIIIYCLVVTVYI